MNIYGNIMYYRCGGYNDNTKSDLTKNMILNNICG